MARVLSALASQPDFRRLRAIALGLLALAAIALPGHYELTQDSAFAMVRDQIDDVNYAYPAHPIRLTPMRGGGLALLVAATPDACDMCQGELSVFYLTPDEDGWRVTGAWPRFASIGALGDVGEVAPIDSGADQAVSFTGAPSSIVELAPLRPVMRAQAG
jgi:hypothetical protein